MEDGPVYTAFKDKLLMILADIHLVHLHHVQLTPHPPSVLGRAPCTEVVTFYDCEDSVMQNVEKFAQVYEKGRPEGYVGNAYGKVMEQIVRHEDIGKDGVEKGAAVVFLVGYVQAVESFSRFDMYNLFS
jgi:hypothetical protein